VSLELDLGLVVRVARYGYHSVRVRRRSRVELLRAAAQASGLEDLERSGRLQPRVTGRRGRLEVELAPFASSEAAQSGTSVKVKIQGMEELTLTGETTARLVDRWARGLSEVVVGDPEFDAALFIQGPPPLVRAVMDAGTRSVLWQMLVKEAIEVPRVAFIESRVTLKAGVLAARVPDGDGDEQLRQLPEVLRTILAAADRLVVQRRDLPARLAGIVKSDPERGVRLECLLQLARDHPGHPAALEALRAGLADRYGEIRLRSALALGEEGRPTLLALAAGDRAGDDCSARAVAALDGHLPVERAEEILEAALTSRRVATACACLAVLGRWGGPEAASGLATHLASGTPVVAAAAARALGARGDPQVELPLVKALRHADREVQMAAAEGLGRAGTIRAVMPLRTLEEEARRDQELGRVVRQAVATIQSRAGGASPGQLTVAGGEVGLLSLPADEEGSLSLTPGSDGPSEGPVRAPR
jgi:hypothetical protein